ncbi:tRNA pseudouridine(55) synthase TruB [Prosthecomicrobium hirschii]|uniref:tRNA pseudouridine synthase B n=1 Tax=Prosthecodimorpha hirschii TaxID=665126 RepID=A0A0P6W2Y1_9HYPH|nr:tRNA pseudouridine(55) synthase TruB [Prosthecomicrobium hirschii]KPL52667.1 pseudouridine synthase [Prosthecomicrobium hirschii]MCW1841549.1 tRNA pseudouridine(55) synthase TruB [Prosthecomicrobium hirschii]
MARRKKFDDVNGWLVLDKPVGMTSTQAVARVKRIMHANKAGHAGTLDPLASGLLPVALGEATKTVSFVMDGRKIYRFVVQWGIETDTDDTEGVVVARSDLRPSRDDVLDILDEFTGEIMQVPPAFSAIKIAGERAYDLARDGEEVILEARPIQVHRLDLVDMPDADTAVFDCECGKGTYVRALARDMGRRLGTRGHVVGLRRLLVGPFGEEDMVPMDRLDELAETGEPAAPRGELLAVDTALAEIPEVVVNRDGAARLRRGQGVILRGRDAPTEAGAVAVTCGGDLVAIGEIEGAELRPVRVFNLEG